MVLIVLLPLLLVEVTSPHARTAEDPRSEEGFEQVLGGGHVIVRPASEAHVVASVLVTVRLVVATLFRIREALEGFRDLLESLVRPGRTTLVGVQLQRQLSVGLLHNILTGVLRDTKDGVV